MKENLIQENLIKENLIKISIKRKSVGGQGTLCATSNFSFSLYYKQVTKKVLFSLCCPAYVFLYSSFSCEICGYSNGHILSPGTQYRWAD